MAHEKQVSIEDVATSGPGLAFVVYPEALGRMPMAPMWAIFFFFMMATLGFGSQLSIMEAVLSSFADEFRRYLPTRKKDILYRSGMILFTFLLGLPMVTKGGIYLLNLIDYSVSGFPLLLAGFFELLALGWFYGADRFLNDISMMIGYRPSRYWKFCWKYVSPLIIGTTMIMNMIFYTRITYNRTKTDVYTYSDFGELLNWFIAFIPMSMIPGFFLYRFCSRGGYKLAHVLCQPRVNWGPASQEDRTGIYSGDILTAVEVEIADFPSNWAYHHDTGSLRYSRMTRESSASTSPTGSTFFHHLPLPQQGGNQISPPSYVTVSQDN